MASFGYGIGDILALTKLAWDAVQNTRKACGEHNELTREASSLHTILQRLKIETSKPESLLSFPDRKEELDGIIAGCSNVLEPLNRIVQKYNALPSGSKRGPKRYFQKLRFGNGEMQDLSVWRQKLSAHTSAISLFINMVSIGSLGRIEKQMSGELRYIRMAVNGITANFLAAERENSEGSVFTVYRNDDRAVWREFRRELIRDGFDSSVIARHKDVIRAYVKELAARGLFDDEPATVSSSEPPKSGISSPSNKEMPDPPFESTKGKARMDAESSLDDDPDSTGNSESDRDPAFDGGNPESDSDDDDDLITSISNPGSDGNFEADVRSTQPQRQPIIVVDKTATPQAIYQNHSSPVSKLTCSGDVSIQEPQNSNSKQGYLDSDQNCMSETKHHWKQAFVEDASDEESTYQTTSNPSEHETLEASPAPQQSGDMNNSTTTKTLPRASIFREIPKSQSVPKQRPVYESESESDSDSDSPIYGEPANPPRERPLMQKTSSYKIVRDINGQRAAERVHDLNNVNEVQQERSPSPRRTTTTQSHTQYRRQRPAIYREVKVEFSPKIGRESISEQPAMQKTASSKILKETYSRELAKLSKLHRKESRRAPVITAKRDRENTRDRLDLAYRYMKAARGTNTLRDIKIPFTPDSPIIDTIEEKEETGTSIMVSFSCEGCGDVLTKKKLDQHRNRCHGASFTCIDCMVDFHGTSYRAHTACMTEAIRRSSGRTTRRSSAETLRTPSNTSSLSEQPKSPKPSKSSKKRSSKRSKPLFPSLYRSK